MPSDAILAAVKDLSEKSGLDFSVTETVVEGTELYVVYATNHPFPDVYTVAAGVLGFRVPHNFPDAQPEDSFFIQPDTVKLKTADQKRNSVDIHRAAPDQNLLKGTPLGSGPALLFSWHIWNKVAWKRGKHTLADHYFHCVKRFEQPEHDI